MGWLQISQTRNLRKVARLMEAQAQREEYRDRDAAWKAYADEMWRQGWQAGYAAGAESRANASR